MSFQWFSGVRTPWSVPCEILSDMYQIILPYVLPCDLQWRFALTVLKLACASQILYGSGLVQAVLWRSDQFLTWPSPGMLCQPLFIQPFLILNVRVRFPASPNSQWLNSTISSQLFCSFLLWKSALVVGWQKISECLRGFTPHQDWFFCDKDSLGSEPWR